MGATATALFGGKVSGLELVGPGATGAVGFSLKIEFEVGSLVAGVGTLAGAWIAWVMRRR